MIAFVGLTCLFIGSFITFFAWKCYFDYYSEKAEKTIRFLKAIKSEKVNIEVIERHEFATPEDVSGLKFGR